MIRKVIKLSAPWCGQCRSYANTFHTVSEMEEFKNISFEEMDIEESDENEAFAYKYGVRSLPTTLILDENDNEITKVVGNVPINTLVDTISQTM